MSPDLLAYVRSLAVVYQAGTIAGVERMRAGDIDLGVVRGEHYAEWQERVIAEDRRLRDA